MANNEFKIVVWRFRDGKPGHDRQSTGLLNALIAAAPLEDYCFDSHKCVVSLWQTLRRELPYAALLPDPDLIIGAGRRCQRPMLQARHARGGNAIYLMKPSVPLRCFDLNLVPRHDNPRQHTKVIVTDGVLNDIVATTPRGDNGLILIGGPSDHYTWNNLTLVEQIRHIIEQSADKKWVIADSRRTPEDTMLALQPLARGRVSLMPYRDSTSTWLAGQFRQSDQIWVSGDSVSMIFEALSAGLAVGVLAVPTKRSSRITAIAEKLAQRNMITTYKQWCQGKALHARAPLAEAARCAAIILSRWDHQAHKLRADG